MAAEDKTILIKIELQEAQAKVNIKKLESSLKSLDGRTKEYSLAVKKLASEELKLQQIQSKKIEINKQLALSNTQLGSSINGISKSSGAASAATLELGRVISDAPYGIRGIANNVSQFASQIAFMSRTMDAATGKAIGLGGAMKSLWKSIMGPLGVLLVIQAVIAALDHFAGSTKKAGDELASLEENSITPTIAKLTVLQKVLNDNNVALEDKISLLNKASSEFKELNGYIEDGDINLDSFNSNISKMISSMKEVAFAKAVIKETEEVMRELVRATVEGVEGADAGWIGTLLDLFSPVNLHKAKAYGENIASINEEYAKLYSLLLGKQEDGSGLLIELLFGGEKKKGSNDRRIKEYKQQLFDLTKFILKQQEEEFAFTERNEWNLLQSKQEFEKKDLIATRDAYLAKNKVRFDNFMKEAKDEGARNRARAEYREANGVAELEFQIAQNALENKQTAEDNEFKRKVQEKHDAAMLQLRSKSSQMALKANQKINGTEAGSVGSPVSKTGAEGFASLEEAYKAAGVVSDEAFETALALKEEQLRLSGLSEEQVKAELAEMSYQNELERTQREIDLEKMKIDAKRNINEEYISWVSGLGSVFQSLAGDNEALAKAALVLEKGAAIAGVVISTQSANAKILAATSTESSALRAQAALAGPAGAPLYAKAIAAEAAGAKRITKNNIGSGISIAKILATTLSSGGASSGGASGSGGAASQDRTFDFNLVGNTGVNQLAQGIAGQFNGPIQAYVVASQVTSQQQLDATIQSNATIG
jgi:hypothetical protein